MLISAHEANNAFYNSVNTPWALGWTAQKNVSAAQVLATGGTYAEKAPVREEKAPETPKKVSGRAKKTQ